jgi:ketosteroid isomerase-like protein
MSSSKLVETAHALIDAYHAQDAEKIMALRTPDCEQVVFPVSLQRPPQKNTEFLAHFSAMKGIFWGWKSEVLDTVVDAPAHKVVLHSIARAESAIGPFENEMVFTIWMTDDDSQIKQVREFVDSAYVREFFGRLMKKKAEAEAAAAADEA